LGLVLIEAQASGLPCILSDVVPEEADVVKPLVQRLPLSKPASAWAKVVLSVKSAASVISPQASLKLVEQSSFNIHASVEQLEECYLG